MKEGWTYKKLGEVCEIQYGYPFDSANFSSSSTDGMPLVRIRDVKAGATETYYKGTYPKEYIVHSGEYLIGMDGEFNIAPWRSADALLNQRVCKICNTKDNVSADYLFRFFSKELKRIEAETPFVTVKHLSAKRLNQVSIPLPPLSEQERIVSELDLLTEVIDKQKAQLKELDTLAQSIFYDMFGDPVLNDKGWEKKKINQIAEGKLSYGSGSSAAPFDGCVRYIRITDIGDDGKLRNDIVSPSVYDEKYILNDGDILFARTGATVGKTYLHKKENGKCIYAGYLIKLVPNKSFVLPDYVYGFTKTAYYKSFVELAQKAVAQPNINAEQYGNLEIPLPPLSLQQSFADKVAAIEQQKAAIGRSIAETQQLFDYTMDKYFG